MATAYTEFDCLGADLLTNLQTAILSSSDWARPNSGTFPTLFKATTTRGAQMCIDLNTTAVNINTLSTTVYRTHDGTTAGDPRTLFLRYKRLAVGTFATMNYHGTVSVGKEHLFIMIEGPRASETSPDLAALGSFRSYIALSDLVPYHTAEDTTPCVIAMGQTVLAAGSATLDSSYAYASRNAANTQSWTPGHLTTLDFPSGNSGIHLNNQLVADSNEDKQSPPPYVFWDNVQGQRGRLAKFFHYGFNFATIPDVPIAAVGSLVTYGSETYKILQVNRGDTGANNYGPLGAVTSTSGGQSEYSPLVAVPYA